MKTHKTRTSSRSRSSTATPAAPLKAVLVALFALPIICAAQTELPAPVARPATSMTATSFTANWNAVTGATDYIISINTDPSFTALFPTINATGIAKTITGLVPSTTYYYRVVAVSGTNTSPNSNTITVSTASPSFPPPVFTSPYTYSAIAGTPFNLQITTDNTYNTSVTYAATGLPVGLAIDPNTGLITGTPTAPAGDYYTRACPKG